MKTYKITQNGETIKKDLTKEEALNLLFCVVEDFTNNNYVYDPEDETVKSPSGDIIAKEGDEYVDAGDDRFEIEEETD